MWTLHQLQLGRMSRNPHQVISCRADPDLQKTRSDVEAVKGRATMWDFDEATLELFPALTRRNFFCVQRHQARALHYDLRMQLDGSTVSWAVPKGLLGISKAGDASRLAIETSLHPISYTIHEGSDGRILPSGIRCGTLLWDIGTYRIDSLDYDEGSDSEVSRRAKRRRQDGGSGDEDSLGQHEEDKFRAALHRASRWGRPKAIHFTLLGGRKLTGHSYILVLPPTTQRRASYSLTGKEKREWFIRLPRGIDEYTWGPQGEEGEQYGRSVKSGRTFQEVCQQRAVRSEIWPAELAIFYGVG